MVKCSLMYEFLDLWLILQLEVSYNLPKIVAKVLGATAFGIELADHEMPRIAAALNADLCDDTSEPYKALRRLCQ